MKDIKISYCGRRNFERFNLPPVLTQLQPEKKTIADKKPFVKAVKKKDAKDEVELFGGHVEDNNFLRGNYDE